MGNPAILYNNLAIGKTITASSGTDQSNVIDVFEFTKWNPTATSSVDVTFDMGSPVVIDSLGLSGHDLGSVTGAVTIKLQKSTNNFTGNTVDITSNISITRDIVIFEKFPSESSRYYRVLIAGHTAAISISNIFLGVAFIFEKGISSASIDPENKKINYNDSNSVMGVPTGRFSKGKTVKNQIKFKLLAPSIFSSGGAYFDFFQNYARTGQPFFWKFDVNVSTAQSQAGQKLMPHFVRLNDGNTINPDRVSRQYRGLTFNVTGRYQA